MTSRTVLRDLLVVAIVAVVAIVLVGGYATYRVWTEGQRDDRRAADAIVVMGAAQYDGRPSPIFAARLDHAIELYHAGVAPRLIATGGKAEGDRTTEAAAARAYAIAHGVRAADILTEDRSRTTYESIQAVAGLMRAETLENAVIVSDRPHMLRVLRMASDAGMRATGSPTTTSPLEQDLSASVDAMVHELGALAQYFLTGGR